MCSLASSARTLDFVHLFMSSISIFQSMKAAIQVHSPFWFVGRVHLEYIWPDIDRSMDALCLATSMSKVYGIIFLSPLAANRPENPFLNLFQIQIKNTCLPPEMFHFFVAIMYIIWSYWIEWHPNDDILFTLFPSQIHAMQNCRSVKLPNSICSRVRSSSVSDLK